MMDPEPAKAPPPEAPQAGANEAPKKEDPKRVENDKKVAAELARDIRYCLTGDNDESGAIRNVKVAVQDGRWQGVQEAFREKYKVELVDWIPQQLDARRQGDIRNLTVLSCEVRDYAKLFFPEGVVDGAHEFYSRCWSATDNEDLAKFVDQKAANPAGLVKMMACYGETYYWHNTNNPHKDDAFNYPSCLSAWEKRMMDRFASVLEHELDDTGYLGSTKLVIQRALDSYAKMKEEPPPTEEAQ